MNFFARVANPPTVCPQSHACDAQHWKSNLFMSSQALQATPLPAGFLGVLTARMSPTAQAGRKSWNMSAPRGRIAFARAGTSKENSRLSRQPFSSNVLSKKGNHHAMHGGSSLGLSLQQRHTICIGARRDNYNSSLQGVDRFTHIMEVDTEHGFLISALLHCGIQLLLVSGQLGPKVNQRPGFDPTRTAEISSTMETLSHRGFATLEQVQRPHETTLSGRQRRNVVQPAKSSMNVIPAPHTSIASV